MLKENIIIHSTPQQDKSVEKSHGETVRGMFKNYESTFVILHPFLQVKEGYNISFDYYKRSNKKEISNGCTRINWAEVIEKAKLKGIKELDNLLAYLHCARLLADRDAWIKFMQFIDFDNFDVAQVDVYPEILIDSTLVFLKQLGYDEIIMYSQTEEKKEVYNIQNLIESHEDFKFSYPRILTPDKKIFFSTDFDNRFTYLSSDRTIIDLMIIKLNLEGFYCDDKTKADWSFEELTTNTIDWNDKKTAINTI